MVFRTRAAVAVEVLARPLVAAMVARVSSALSPALLLFTALVAVRGGEQVLKFTLEAQELALAELVLRLTLPMQLPQGLAVAARVALDLTSSWPVCPAMALMASS